MGGNKTLEKAVQTTENKMGTMPVNKLLLTMSIPMVISMLIQALYNIVDSIFVARIGEDALTAVSLAFPLQNLMIAVASGTGVGVNALLSKSLGAKDFKLANRTANVSVFLALMNWLVFIVFGIFFTDIYFRAQTDIEVIIDYGNSYLRIVSIISIGVFGQIMGERLLQATGKTFFTMITQGVGAIINIIFDPIMIFGLFGFPEMGVAGAALATVFGQVVAMILTIIFNLKYNKDLKFSLKEIRPNGKIIARIYKVGVPSIIMLAISSVMTFAMNKILIAFSATAAAVFGVYYKLQSFVFMPIIGMNNGMVPIIAYNYGAERPDRIKKTMRYAVCYAIGLMLIGLALFQFIPDKLLFMFSASEDMLSIGIPALRTISWSFLIAGFCVVSLSVLQALGRGVSSLIVSVSRQLVVLVPVAYLLSMLGNVDYVWWAFPIAEFVSLVICVVMVTKTFKSIDAPPKTETGDFKEYDSYVEQ